MAADPLDSSTFPDYTGDPSSVNCRKCGGDTFFTYWASDALTLCTNGQLNGKENYTGSDDPGFLIRQCATCSYCRGEKTVDASEQPLTAARPEVKPVKSTTVTVNQLPFPTDAGPLYTAK